jgi:hypothetical protein
MDSTDGRDRAPDRYSSHGRETIDRQRDASRLLAYDLVQRLVDSDVPPDARRFLADNAAAVVVMLADQLFAYHCMAQCIRYADRTGRKGGADGAAADKLKRRFYAQMFRHVSGAGLDPRASREGYVPYSPQRFCDVGVADV